MHALLAPLPQGIAMDWQQGILVFLVFVAFGWCAKHFWNIIKEKSGDERDSD